MKEEIKMKKHYEAPRAEELAINVEDIIMASAIHTLETSSIGGREVKWIDIN